VRCCHFFSSGTSAAPNQPPAVFPKAAPPYLSHLGQGRPGAAAARVLPQRDGAGDDDVDDGDDDGAAAAGSSDHEDKFDDSDNDLDDLDEEEVDDDCGDNFIVCLYDSVRGAGRAGPGLRGLIATARAADCSAQGALHRQAQPRHHAPQRPRVRRWLFASLVVGRPRLAHVRVCVCAWQVHVQGMQRRV
jgi:hypothetical protein